MALSYVTYSGGAVDGIITKFSVTMDYIEQAHVLVYLDGVLKTLTTDYTWFNSTTIEFNTAPTAGTVVHFRRTTPASARLVDFQDAGNLTEADLDTSADQNFMLTQESQDDISDNAMVLDTDDKWAAESKVIKEVADGVADTDGVNLLQLTSITSGAAAAAAASAAAALVSEGLADADATATAADVATTNADAISTSADAVSTAADEANTDADATATSADAVSTAADAIATAADAVSTGNDAVSTAADAIATAADEVLTDADATATAADAVSTAADVVLCDAAYDAFDDRYLGSKASAPTLDNDSNALLTGALYWNSTTSLMNAYSGSAWSVVGNADIGALAPTKGRLIVGNGSAFVDLGVGSNDQQIIADSTEAKGLKWATVTGGPEVFESTHTNYTGASQVITLENHGLTGTPQELTTALICTTADGGYAIGDVITIPFSSQQNSVNQWKGDGVQVWATSTQVGMVTANQGLKVGSKTAGAPTTLTASSWDIYAIVKYYA